VRFCPFGPYLLETGQDGNIAAITFWYGA